MAQIPTSNITMAAIATEVGVSTSSISMANLRNNSISYVNSDETNNNANAAPDNMRDWAGYLHTQTFATPTYYARTGTGTSDYCVYQTAVAGQTNEAHANSAAIFYCILNGNDLEFYVQPDHNQVLLLAGTETAAWYNTSGTQQNFSGNFSSGFTAVKIADLDVTGVGSVLRASITTAGISGTGTHQTAVSGFSHVNSGATFTPSSTKYFRAPKARALAACYSTDTKQPYHSVVFRVFTSDDSFTPINLNTFVSRLYASATSNNCL